MRELMLRGKVRRVESGTWTDKKTGEIKPQGQLVLAGDFDKFEISLDQNPSDRVIAKLKAIREGQDVELLVGVKSGDSFRADPRFVFLDDLTPPGAKA